MGQEHIMIHQKGGEGGKSREGMRERWEWGLWAVDEVRRFTQ